MKLKELNHGVFLYNSTAFLKVSSSQKSIRVVGLDGSLKQFSGEEEVIHFKPMVTTLIGVYDENQEACSLVANSFGEVVSHAAISDTALATLKNKVDYKTVTFTFNQVNGITDNDAFRLRVLELKLEKDGWRVEDTLTRVLSKDGQRVAEVWLKKVS